MIYLASLEEQVGDKLEGYYIIKTKAELEQVITDNTVANKVIIRDDFAAEYFTPSGLLTFVKNARRINKNLIIEISKEEEVKYTDGLKKKMREAKSADELVTLALLYPKEFLDSINLLTASMESYQREILAAANKVSRLQTIIESQRREISNLQEALGLEQQNKMIAFSKLDSLVKRINHQYGVKVDESTLFEVDGSKFDKVLYFKEYTRVQYTDTFLYYLREILKVLYGLPVRFVVIESFYATAASELYPSLTPHFKLKESDVISGDVLMLGIQPKLMQDILKNASGVSILVVLDRCGYAHPHVRGKNVEYFFLVSDIKDIPKSIPKERVISYSDETMVIPYVRDFENLDTNTKMARYSSFNAMKKVISCLER